eukprot:5846928-Ditylum_brightwellii.AAC.1
METMLMCGNIPRVFISAQYHVIFDGMFTTVVVSSDKGVPKDTSKDKNDTITSKGAPKEYNRATKCDLSFLTKKIQSSLKSKVPIFQNPSWPSTRNNIVAKNKPPEGAKECSMPTY